MSQQWHRPRIRCMRGSHGSQAARRDLSNTWEGRDRQLSRVPHRSPTPQPHENHLPTHDHGPGSARTTKWLWPRRRRSPGAQPEAAGGGRPRAPLRAAAGPRSREASRGLTAGRRAGGRLPGLSSAAAPRDGSGPGPRAGGRGAAGPGAGPSGRAGGGPGAGGVAGRGAQARGARACALGGGEPDLIGSRGWHYPRVGGGTSRGWRAAFSNPVSRSLARRRRRRRKREKQQGGRSRRGAMAALERPVPSPEAFLGQPWAAWVREAAPPHAHGAAPPHSKGRDRPAARRAVPLPAAHARPGHGCPPPRAPRVGPRRAAGGAAPPGAQLTRRAPVPCVRVARAGPRRAGYAAGPEPRWGKGARGRMRGAERSGRGEGKEGERRGGPAGAVAVPEQRTSSPLFRTMRAHLGPRLLTVPLLLCRCRSGRDWKGGCEKQGGDEAQ